MAQAKAPPGAILLLFAALVFSGAVSGATPPASDIRPTAPLERRVSLDLWGVGLGDALKEIRNQTGVEILVFPSDLPPEETAGGLYLVSGDVSLRTALECLARRYAFRYRVSGEGKIELSRGYGWAGNEPALRFLRLDAFLPPNADAGAARTLLREFLKPLPLAAGDFSLILERVPAPNDRSFLRAVAVLPPAMADWLERAVKCLGGDAGDWPAAGQRPARLFATARRADADWRDILSRQVAFPRSGDLRTTLAALCSQAGVAILLQSPGTGQFSSAGLPEGNIGLGRASEEMVKKLGLERRVFLAAGAIAFESGPGAAWEMDDRSREIFWSGQAVAGFDVRAAAEKAGGGDALAARLKREVFPTVWRDPATAAVYCRENGRLVLIAPLDAVAAAAAWLENHK